MAGPDIISHVDRIVSLNEQEKTALRAIVESKNVVRKQFIVQPGFVCKEQFYVQKGAFRAYLIGEDGNEHTIQLAEEDWFISDFNSYIQQSEATLYVEAMEKGTVQKIAFDAVEALCDEFPIFDRFFRIVAQKSFAFAQKRILTNLALSAEARYLEFKARYPSMENRFPQYILASYLGMSAEFLSKIKKKQS